MVKQRLDLTMVNRNLAPSREKAQAYILAGEVKVNGVIASKAGKTIQDSDRIEVLEKDHPYVSRGGVKLESALAHFKLSPKGMTALDIGASTGGFTHCLILHGATKVYAIDVGYGQLAWELRNDPKVVCMERTNARYLTSEQLEEVVDLIVIDASFISLALLLPTAWQFVKPQGHVIALVKPQFEAGKDQLGKRGKISETTIHLQVVEQVRQEAQEIGFLPMGWVESTIVGKKSGNKEFFWLLQKPYTLPKSSSKR